MLDIQLNNIVGDSFEDMSVDEMALAQGMASVEGRSAIATIVASKKLCVATAAGVTAVIGSISAWFNNN